MIISSIYMICFGIAIVLWAFLIRKDNNTYGLLFYRPNKYDCDLYCKIVGKYFYLIGVSYFIYGVLSIIFSEYILTIDIARFVYETLVGVTFFFYVFMIFIEINSKAKKD